MKNKLIFFLVLIISFIFSVILFYDFSKLIEQPIGEQRDEHGCLINENYSWNETEQMCVKESTRNTCPNNRGDYCIALYDPVCGVGDFGVKKYSNSCFACLDEQVKYYVQGECK